MKQQSFIRTCKDQNLLSFWRGQASLGADNTALKQYILQQEDKLLPRFSEYYKKLKALPRQVRRYLQRRWKQSLAGLALLLALGQTPVLAATINVGGACTLARAIRSANNDDSRFCTPGSGADEIVLHANSRHRLTAADNRGYGRTGLPVIRSVITVDGNGSTIRRASAAPKFRILAVGHTGNLTLRQTTVSGGVAAGSVTGSRGGGLLNYGTLILTNSTISGNLAREGGGVSSRTSFTHGNLASVTLTNSTISGNTAIGDLSIGGGVYNGFYANLSVTNSTISRNTAGGEGGGVDNGYSASLSMANSTISGNAAGGEGGGVNNDAHGDVTLIRTLVSGNTAMRGAEIINNRSTITAGNFNLFGHRGVNSANAFLGFTPGATDITATSDGYRPTALAAILDTSLANNGGPTQTHALVAGSPAIDAVTDGTCPPPDTDQRGVSRPQDGNGDGGSACDIGSYEFVFTSTAPVQAPPQSVAPTPPPQSVAPAPTQPVAPETAQPQ
jgi:hypothetical protein